MEKYSDAFIKYLESREAVDWHKAVADYNQEIGTAPLRWLVDNPLTDRGTALMIYWYLILILGQNRRLSRDEVSKYSIEWYVLCLDLEKKYMAGFYTNSNIAYDPKNDEGADFTAGYDNFGIPKEMYEKTEGEIVERGDLVEGMPEEVNDTVVELNPDSPMETNTSENSSGIEYWVYRTHIASYGAAEVIAKLVTPSGHENNKFYYGDGENRVEISSPRQNDPYGVNLQLKYMINSRHPIIDNYCDSHGFTIYSLRLVELMREFDVKFESFPVVMVDKENNVLSDKNYYIFHLLEPILDAMDVDRSKWVDFDTGVDGLYLDLDIFEHRPLFTCNHVWINLMRNDLKQEISKRGISGFGFLDPVKYKSGEFGFSPPYEG